MPRSPHCTKGKTRKQSTKQNKSWKLASSWDTLALKLPSCFSREVSPHTSRTGIPPKAGLPLTDLPISLRPPQQERKNSTQAALVSKVLSGADLRLSETRQKGITFSLHQVTLMPLDRKEQETRVCVGKEERGN